jgi:ATP-dependent protease ClpP protease subunit
MIKFLLLSSIVGAGLTVNAVENTTTIKLDTGNFIALTTQVDDNSISALSRGVMMSDSKEMYIYISSPGGSVMALNDFKGIMRASGKKFICIVDFAASAAFTLTQMCDLRLVSEYNSTLMQHQASFGLGRADQNNQESFYNYIKTLLSEFTENEAARLGYTPSQYMDIVRHDWWLTGKQAVEATAADGFANTICTPRLLKEENIVIFPTMFGDIEVTYSKCPLIKAPIAIKWPWGMEVKEQLAYTMNYNFNRVWGFSDVKRTIN